MNIRRYFVLLIISNSLLDEQKQKSVLLFLNIFVAIKDGVFLFPKKNLQRSVL